MRLAIPPRLLALTLVALLGAATGAAHADTPHHIPSGRFSVMMPDDWQLLRISDDPQVEIFRIQSIRDNVVISMSVVHLDASPINGQAPLTDTQFFTNAQEVERGTGYSPAGARRLSIEGCPARNSTLRRGEREVQLHGCTPGPGDIFYLWRLDIPPVDAAQRTRLRQAFEDFLTSRVLLLDPFNRPINAVPSGLTPPPPLGPDGQPLPLGPDGQPAPTPPAPAPAPQPAPAPGGQPAPPAPGTPTPGD